MENILSNLEQWITDLRAAGSAGKVDRSNELVYTWAGNFRNTEDTFNSLSKWFMSTNCTLAMSDDHITTLEQKLDNAVDQLNRQVTNAP